MILNGEIRDGDTAAMGLRAPRQDLVLSTVHATTRPGRAQTQDWPAGFHDLSTLLCSSRNAWCVYCARTQEALPVGRQERQVFGIQPDTIYAAVGSAPASRPATGGMMVAELTRFSKISKSDIHRRPPLRGSGKAIDEGMVTLRGEACADLPQDQFRRALRVLR
jgi:type II secretory ATPase GspE/PulE/Tfp pilus assembly ATPase PilB-like protein